MQAALHLARGAFRAGNHQAGGFAGHDFARVAGAGQCQHRPPRQLGGEDLADPAQRSLLETLGERHHRDASGNGGAQGAGTGRGVLGRHGPQDEISARQRERIGGDRQGGWQFARQLRMTARGSERGDLAGIAPPEQHVEPAARERCRGRGAPAAGADNGGLRHGWGAWVACGVMQPGPRWGVARPQGARGSGRSPPVGSGSVARALRIRISSSLRLASWSSYLNFSWGSRRVRTTGA